jgi:ribosomal protein S18 acetylase RimI-like enzyme
VIASQEDRISFYKQFLDGFQLLFNAMENRVVEEGDGWQVCLTEWSFALFNRVFIHSARPEAMVEVDAILESHKIPVLINLIGGGLQHVKALQDAGYVLRWTTPFMIWTSDDSQDDFVLRDGLSVKHLDGYNLDVLKTIYKESFVLSDDVVNLMGGLLFAHPLAATYGLFKDGEIVSAVMAIEYEGTIGVWNMATPIAHQKNGYGEQLLRHVMKRYKNLGAEKFFLTSSPAGKALYDKCGWQVLDYMPVFSK